MKIYIDSIGADPQSVVRIAEMLKSQGHEVYEYLQDEEQLNHLDMIGSPELGIKDQIYIAPRHDVDASDWDSDSEKNKSFRKHLADRESILGRQRNPDYGTTEFEDGQIRAYMRL